MIVVHLTASTFFGGPERQMLGLARHLDAGIRSAFLSFAEGGRCADFLQVARIQGHPARALDHDTPRLFSAAREISAELTRLRADLLCCHGYKADLVGRIAARRSGIPVVAVSRGWTGENLKVRLYEWLDRVHLRWMDRVVCVSEGQAEKVRRTVSPERIEVIRNAIDATRFAHVAPGYQQRLQTFFAQPRRYIIGSAGRLSPEKGFGIFLKAARRLVAHDPSLGFVHFGEGPLRKSLEQEAEAAGLGELFVFAGHRPDFDRFLPFLDLMVLPSFTEGLPNVVLEAFAAAVPVVATAVGGTPEVVEDDVSGRLVPPGDVEMLADAIRDVLFSEARRRSMGYHARERVRDEFSFATQARAYERLFTDLVPSRTGVTVQREAA